MVAAARIGQIVTYYEVGPLDLLILVSELDAELCSTHACTTVGTMSA